MPGGLAGALILAVWIYHVWRGNAGLAGRCTALSAVLIVTWSLFAPLFLFLLPTFSDFRLFLDRYYSSALPGQALLLGGLISSIRPGIGRKALLVVLVAASILAQGKLTVRSHNNEDWRAALEFVKQEAGTAEPVLLQSCFVEGADFAALRDAKLRDVLFAPALVYGEPVKSIRLPNVFSGRYSRDAEDVVRQLELAPRFLLLQGDNDPSFEMWLLGRLGPRCRSEQAESFGYISLRRFSCQDRR